MTLQIAIVAFVVLYLLFGLWLTIEHDREARECIKYLREHRGEDKERDGHCYWIIRQGQG